MTDPALKAAVERVTQVTAMTLNGLTILRSISDVYHPIKGQPARLMFADDLRTLLAALSSREAETAELRAQNDVLEIERLGLRAAIFGSQDYDPKLRHANFIEMARTTEAARQGALSRAIAAEAALSSQASVMEGMAKGIAACEGEQEHFETWAKASRYEMHEHPLHYIFMNEKTNAARMGWIAALAYARTLGDTHLPVKKRGDVWHYDLTIGGNRYRGSTVLSVIAPARKRDGLREAIADHLDQIESAADSFRDCDGDEVAGQVLIRIKNARQALRAGEKG